MTLTYIPPVASGPLPEDSELSPGSLVPPPCADGGEFSLMTHRRTCTLKRPAGSWASTDAFGPDFKHVDINTLRYADDTTLMAESEEKLKRLLMKVKEVSEKACLKLNIKKK